MSKTLEQIAYEIHDRRFAALHGQLPEPEPYPSIDGIDVQIIDVVPVEHWVPACNGAEQPFTVNGTRWLYVWCKELGQHGYYNMDTDIVETDRDFHPCNT